jgi:hypothetical protein
MASSISPPLSARTKNALSFVSSALGSNQYGPRLGRLSFQGRSSIETPHYLALSSRGVIPHLSQDMVKENTAINGFYSALEDCESPVLNSRHWLRCGVLTGWLLLELVSR